MSGDSCCGSCIKFILAAAVLKGLLFWIIVRPTGIKFHVTDATLTQFNFSTNDNNLHYDLSLDLIIRNPNKVIGVYYEIKARVLYEGQRVSTVTLTPFYQDHKTTNVLKPVFQGQQLMIVGSNLLGEFNQHKSAGVYEIELKLYLGLRFKLGRVKTGKFKPRVECDLKVPLSSSGKLVGTFPIQKCSIDYFN